VYFTSDERIELRDLLRVLGQALGLRVELRQLGARDEAKMVGGIGSCGRELCCTTWLPDFVPVSIKMAKDQGLVLSPTKVAGQCGRLKCCLVYEQAAYAEMRKGLPKLGKRVITADGEGRVVEVDVLRRRVRVAYGPGDSQVLAADQVRPMFLPGGRPGAAEPEVPDDASDDSGDDPVSDDPSSQEQSP
jgi:cell fate regulator YaaT (PSP1 superfamily)